MLLAFFCVQKQSGPAPAPAHQQRFPARGRRAGAGLPRHHHRPRERPVPAAHLLADSKAPLPAHLDSATTLLSPPKSPNVRCRLLLLDLVVAAHGVGMPQKGRIDARVAAFVAAQHLPPGLSALLSLSPPQKNCACATQCRWRFGSRLSVNYVSRAQALSATTDSL